MGEMLMMRVAAAMMRVAAAMVREVERAVAAVVRGVIRVVMVVVVVVMVVAEKGQRHWPPSTSTPSPVCPDHLSNSCEPNSARRCRIDHHASG